MAGRAAGSGQESSSEHTGRGVSRQKDSRWIGLYSRNTLDTLGHAQDAEDYIAGAILLMLNRPAPQ